MLTDPISDLLTRIRNAGIARHARTTCPASRLKKAVADFRKVWRVLADEFGLEPGTPTRPPARVPGPWPWAPDHAPSQGPAART